MGTPIARELFHNLHLLCDTALSQARAIEEENASAQTLPACSQRRQKRNSGHDVSLHSMTKMSSRKLVTLFSMSEETNDLYHKYTCYFNGCSEFFSSYRNEAKAIDKFSKHMGDHITTLVKAHNTQESQEKVFFKTIKAYKASANTKKKTRLKQNKENLGASSSNSKSGYVDKPQKAVKSEKVVDTPVKPEQDTPLNECAATPNSDTNIGNKLKRVGRRREPTIPPEEKLRAEQLLKELREAAPKNRPKELKCLICKTQPTFTAHSTLVNHYKSHAGHRPFKCEKCDSEFTRYVSLDYHNKVHSNTYKYFCDQCQKKFRSATHYKVHYRIHTGEKPWKCGQCEDRFGNRNSYKRHLSKKHNLILRRDNTVEPMSPLSSNASPTQLPRDSLPVPEPSPPKPLTLTTPVVSNPISIAEPLNQRITINSIVRVPQSTPLRQPSSSSVQRWRIPVPALRTKPMTVYTGPNRTKRIYVDVRQLKRPEQRGSI